MKRIICEILAIAIMLIILLCGCDEMYMTKYIESNADISHCNSVGEIIETIEVGDLEGKYEFVGGEATFYDKTMLVLYYHSYNAEISYTILYEKKEILEVKCITGSSKAFEGLGEIVEYGAWDKDLIEIKKMMEIEHGMVFSNAYLYDAHKWRFISINTEGKFECEYRL